MGKFILTSGGLLDGQRGNKLDKIIKKYSQNKKILFVDNATITGSNVAGISNIISNLEKFGGIVTRVTLTKNNLKDVKNYNLTYITGGDLTPLLELVNSTNIGEIFEDYLKNGGVIIGESAGSIIFGHNLKWYYDIKKGTKPKYDIILPTYKGFGLCNINIYPHYNKTDAKQKQKINEYEKRENIKITPLKDGEYIIINFMKTQF